MCLLFFTPLPKNSSTKTKFFVMYVHRLLHYSWTGFNDFDRFKIHCDRHHVFWTYRWIIHSMMYNDFLKCFFVILSKCNEVSCCSFTVVNKFFIKLFNNKWNVTQHLTRFILMWAKAHPAPFPYLCDKYASSTRCRYIYSFYSISQKSTICFF